MNAATIRRIATQVLSDHAKTCKVSVRATNHPCTRHLGCYYEASLYGWTPDPIADEVEKQIKTRADDKGLGVLVRFVGRFIQS